MIDSSSRRAARCCRLVATAAAVTSAGAALLPSVKAAPPAPAKPGVATTTMVKPAIPAAAPKLPDNVAARVDGHDITRDQVLAVFNMTGGRDIIRQMIQVVVLENEAKKQGIVISDTELNAVVTEMKNKFVSNVMQQGGQPGTFSELAGKYGISEEYVRYSAQLDLLRRKTFTKEMEAQIPPLENQVKLEHILIATVPLGAPPSPDQKPQDQAKKDADAKAKIETLQADIKAGKISFEEAAKQNSDDTSNKADGGALDWVGRGVLDKNFEDAAFKLTKAGEISGPVKSQFGWHLIKLVARGSDAPVAERTAYRSKQVERIKAQAASPQALQGWFETVMGAARVVPNPSVKLVPNAMSPVSMLYPVPVKTKPGK